MDHIKKQLARELKKVQNEKELYRLALEDIMLASNRLEETLAYIHMKRIAAEAVKAGIAIGRGM